MIAAWLLAGLLLVHVPASASEPDCLALTDFSTAPLGRFPPEWKARKDAGRRVYLVQEEQGRRFLRALSEGLGIQAGRETNGWSLQTHPVLTWSWRVGRFPSGSDERASATNDSALAVYMLVPYSRVLGPRAVKYIWSERVAAGERLSSNAGLTTVRVLRSGAAGGGWQQERVNVLEDYRAGFGEAGTPTPAGIAVLTDADDTRSVAAGDYGDFHACRR